MSRKELVQKIKSSISGLLRDMIDDCKESWRYEYDCEAGYNELCEIKGYLYALLDLEFITEDQHQSLVDAANAFQEVICTGYTNHGTKQRKALMKLLDEL